MSTLPLNILVTGLLRTPERLRASIGDWSAMRSEGTAARVVMVTWESEAERDPDLCAELRDAGVELIIRPDTKIRGIGNIWPQMYSMEVGLDAFEPGDLIFKTRADLWLDPSFLAGVARTPGYLDLDLPDGAARRFERRVWIPWFERSTPFYWSDECFVGLASDLRVLINYDESYSLRYPASCGVTHYRRFVHPFRGISDRTETFLERFTDTGIGRADRWERLSTLLADDTYLSCLAASYAVGASHFRFACPDGVMAFRDWSTGTPEPGDGPMTQAFTPDQAGLEAGHLFCNDDTWLHRLLAGELPADRLGDRFRHALDGARREGFGWTRPSAWLPAPAVGHAR